MYGWYIHSRSLSLSLSRCCVLLSATGLVLLILFAAARNGWMCGGIFGRCDARVSRCAAPKAPQFIYLLHRKLQVMWGGKWVLLESDLCIFIPVCLARTLWNWDTRAALDRK